MKERGGTDAKSPAVAGGRVRWSVFETIATSVRFGLSVRGLALGVAMLALGAAGYGASVAFGAGVTSSSKALLFWIGPPLIVGAVVQWAWSGATRYCLDTLRGGNGRLGSVLAGGGAGGRVIAACTVAGLAALPFIGLIVALLSGWLFAAEAIPRVVVWTAACAIGFLAIYVQLGFAFIMQVLADRRCGVLEAVAISWRLARGQRVGLSLLCGILTLIEGLVAGAARSLPDSLGVPVLALSGAVYIAAAAMCLTVAYEHLAGATRPLTASVPVPVLVSTAAAKGRTAPSATPRRPSPEVERLNELQRQGLITRQAYAARLAKVDAASRELG